MGNLPHWGLSTAPFFSPAAVEVIPFLGPAAKASVDSMRVAMTSGKGPVEVVRWVVELRCKKRRPCDGDHTQHPSGTAERNTL